MNILFVSHLTLDFSNSSLYVDLINKIGEEHKITVVSDLIKSELVTSPNITLVDLNLNIFKFHSPYIKGILTLLADRLLKRKIKKLELSDFDLMIYPTPPIFYTKTLTYIKNKTTIKTLLMLKDIFPQNAVDEGYLKEKGLLYKYFRKKEKKLYRLSDFIGCMSKGNIDYVYENNPEIDKEKIILFPNTRKDLIHNNISKEPNVDLILKNIISENKVIFVFGGNLTIAQGIEFLTKAILENTNPNAYFIIVGSGTLLEYMKDQLNSSKNVSVLDRMSVSEFDYLMNYCDVGIISLADFYSIPNYPSRSLTYMRSGLPILAITDVVTDVKDIIEDNNFGIWCRSGDYDCFNKQVDLYVSNEELRKKHSKISRQFFLDNYEVEKSIDIIKSILNKNNHDVK